MLYAVICDDAPGKAQVREDERPAHRAYLAESGVVRQAGPFLNAAGEMCGSLILIEVADQTAADAWAAGDPYARAGLFATTSVRPWKRLIG